MRERLKHLPRRQCALLAALQLVLVALLIGLNFAGAARQTPISLPLDDLWVVEGQVPTVMQPDALVIGPSEDGTAATLLSTELELPRGSYQVVLDAATDTAGTVFSLVLPVRDLAEAGTIELAPNSTRLTCTLTLEQDVPDAQLKFEYAGGTVAIRSLSLIPTADLANRPVLAMALVFLLADLVLWLLHTRTKPQIGVFVLVACIGLAASLPFLVDYITSGMDLRFHLARIEGIRTGLLAGQFPVRVQDLWYGGTGYPVSVMYGDLFLYIPAALRVLGLSLPASWNVFCIVLNLFTAACAWVAFRRILGNTCAGLVCTTLYTLCPYRLTNLTTRAALGEVIATAFFPLVLLGLYLLYFDQTPRGRGWLWLALGFAGMVNSHILSCLMAAGLAGLWALCFLRRTFTPQVLWGFARAAAAAAGLCLGFLVPFLDYSRLPLEIYAASSSQLRLTRLYLPQIFSLFPPAVGSENPPSLGLTGEMGYCVGAAMLPGLFALFYAAYLLWGNADRGEEERRLLRLGGASLAISAVLLAAVTDLLPLDVFAALPLVGRAVSSLQFLSRLLVPLSLTLALAAGCGVRLLMLARHSAWRPLAAAACLCAFVSTFSFSDELLLRGKGPYPAYDISALELSNNHFHEYLYDDLVSSTRQVQFFRDARVYSQDEGVSVGEVKKNSLELTVQCANAGSQPGRVVTSLLYWPYFRAADAATGEALPLGAGPDHFLQVELPAGFDGAIRVWFREPLLWRAAELGSLVCAGALFVLCRRRTDGTRA